MIKHYLPEREVFERYDPRIRPKLINNYHDKLAERHDWFVRSPIGKERPFYTNGSLSSVIENVTFNAEIINCNWESQTWDTIPYQYYVISENGALTEVYHGPNDYLVGRKSNGKWLQRYYDDRKNHFRGDDTFWHMGNIHGNAECYGKSIRIKSSKRTKEDLILPILKCMKAKKWRGFYDDFINRVLIDTGLTSLFERYY